MLPRLALLPIGLFILWCFVCQRWYVCHIKQKCGTELTEPQLPAVSVVDNNPLVFNWSDPNPVIRPSFDAYRDSLIKALPAGQLFEITGLYAEQESIDSQGANLGLLRGEKIKALFSNQVKAEQIVVSSDLLKMKVDSVHPFTASRFNFRQPPDKEKKETTVECLEQGGGLTILFPYGQAHNEVDEKIGACMVELISFMKANNEATVAIIGHTDNAGSAEYNRELGFERAKHIMNLLVKQGISKNRISIRSQGEEQPVSSNDTEEGSRLNRRAVLQLNTKTTS